MIYRKINSYLLTYLLTEFGLAVLSAPQEVGHTILSGATYCTNFTQQKEPISADDICLFLLDILTLCYRVFSKDPLIHVPNF